MMRQNARPGISTAELDAYGAEILLKFGAKSAPNLVYKFPGCTCISLNQEICHGVPRANRILKEGDLINIDVSAELNGYWSDNGGSFVLGNDINKHEKLVSASKEILRKALRNIKSGVKIADLGYVIESEAKRSGFSVIKNLAGHGVGKDLHEQPDDILNFKNPFDQRRFRKNTVLAIETFISTHSTYAIDTEDGWTMVGNKGGFTAQHEHTIIVTDQSPIILTSSNGIFE